MNQLQLTLKQAKFVSSGLINFAPTCPVHRNLHRVLRESIRAFDAKRHRGVILAFNDNVMVQAATVAGAITYKAAEVRAQGKDVDVREFVGVVDQLTSVRAYVEYPDMLCPKCGKIADKHSLLTIRSCNRRSCAGRKFK